MRIKGRYVALVEINIDYERKEGMKDIKDLRHHYAGGEFTWRVRNAIANELLPREGTVTVTQQYADLYEVEEDG